MVVKEIIDINGRTFQRHYSDNNKIIHKVGTDEYYEEAIDLLERIWEYEETDTDIEKPTIEGE